MEEIHRTILRENLIYLLENLKALSFIDQIYSSEHKILSEDDYEKILAQDTESNQIRQIVLILQKSGPKAFDVCIHALKTSGQAFIAEELQKEKSNDLLADSENAVSQSPMKESNGLESSWKQSTCNANSTSDLKGYIQHVQEKCQSAKGYWYSSFVLQTGEQTYQRCLTFFPDLHKSTLDRYAKEKIPVFLKDCSYFVPSKKTKYETDTIKINKDTEFENVEVEFDYNPRQFTRLADIDKSWCSKFIFIKVEIVKEDAPVKRMKDGNELEMQVKYVRDKEGCMMKLTAWERFVSLLSIRKWYELSNVSVQYFEGICKLSTNVGTSATEANAE